MKKLLISATLITFIFLFFVGCEKYDNQLVGKTYFSLERHPGETTYSGFVFESGNEVHYVDLDYCFDDNIPRLYYVCNPAGTYQLIYPNLKMKFNNKIIECKFINETTFRYYDNGKPYDFYLLNIPRNNF